MVENGYFDNIGLEYSEAKKLQKGFLKRKDFLEYLQQKIETFLHDNEEFEYKFISIINYL